MEILTLIISTILVYEEYVLIVLLSSFERLTPRRATASTEDSKRPRWAGNFLIYVLNRLLLWLLPIGTLGLAVICAERGWGLLNQVDLPFWLEFALTVILIEGFTYAIHILLHRVPLLWRLHRLHHTDLHVDFSTAVRTHPLERVFVSAVGLCMVVAIGPAPIQLLAAAPFLIAVRFFNHANLRLPESVDRWLRLFIVTPDMHRIHHSQMLGESMSNFGDVFPWFDRLFGTYRADPQFGHDNLVFGVAEFTDRKHMMPHWMLAQPFLTPKRELQPVDGKGFELVGR